MEMEDKPVLASTISYCCDLCNYKTKCNFEMEIHMCNPTEPQSVDQDEIGNLKFLLYLEKFKNKMYVNIIKRNTNIDLDDINVNDVDKSMVICNEIKKNIPIFFHNCNDQDRLQKKNEIGRGDEVKVEPPKKHVRYRSMKVEGSGESKNESLPQESVTKLREEPEIKVNFEEIQGQFTDLFNEIDQNKVQTKYNRLFTDLKNKRLKLFPTITDIQDYSQLVQNHIEILETSLKKKDIPDKKIKNLIGSKSLSPLECRLVSYPNYHNTSIEVDEMELLLNNVSSINKAVNEYIPFDRTRFIKHISNYSCSLLTIDTLINNLLFNQNGYNTYIYVSSKNDKRSDNFRFYYLESITRGKRNWTMDCRLERLLTDLTNTVLPYMITMFRKLYKDTFQDNHYRSNYNSFSQLTEIDCEQLFKNIFTVGHHKRFRSYLINKVMEKATYVPGENDKFNMTGDDMIQKKKYINETETDFGEIINQLFDNIGFEEKVELYKNKKTAYATQECKQECKQD